MAFAFPIFLFALGVLAIPVIIHLFRFKVYKTIVFSDTRFLKQLKIETKKKRNIKNWLLLLSRILALVAMVLAFSRPFLLNQEQEDKNNQKKYWIFLDNSYSMLVNSDESDLFSKSKTKLLDWLESLPESYRISMLSHSGIPIENLSPGSAKQWVQNQKTGPATYLLSEVEALFFARKLDETGLVVSDFQLAFADKSIEANNDSRLHYLAVQPNQVLNNILIDSIWISPPFLVENMAANFHILISNPGQTETPVNFRLYIDETNKAIDQFTVSPFSTKEIILPFSVSKFGNGRIEVDANGPFFDDQIFFTLPFINESKIWIWDEDDNSNYWQQLFNEPNWSISLNNRVNTNSEAISGSNLFILNHWDPKANGIIESIQRELNEGATALVTASTNGKMPFEPENYEIDSGFFRTNFSDNYLELFAGALLDIPQNPLLPVVYKRFKLKKLDFKTILQYEDDIPALATKPYGKGSLIVLNSSFDEDWSNWKTQPLMVPLIINSALMSRGISNLNMQGKPGASINVPYKVQGDAVLKATKSGVTFIPLQSKNGVFTKIYYSPEFAEPGNYKLHLNGDTVGQVSINIPKSESKLLYISDKTFSDSKSSPFVTDKWLNHFKNEESSRFWKLFAWLALLFLLLESIISRWSIIRTKTTKA